MQFIDAHHHLWNPISATPEIGYQWLRKIGQKKPFGDPTPIQRDYLLEEFLQESKLHEIIASVHVQSDGAIPNPVLETAWVDDISQQNNFPIVTVAFVDLAKQHAYKQLEQHAQYQSLRGVRQIIGHLLHRQDLCFAQTDLLKDSLWCEQFQLLKEFDLSFDLQLYPEQLHQAADFFSHHESTPVVIDHAASPYNQTLEGFSLWSKGLESMAQLSNVYIKLSGFGMYEKEWNAHSIKEYFQTIHELFGADRMMFGSNFPVDKLMRDYDFMLEHLLSLAKDLSSKEQNQLFCETAKEFYKVDQLDLYQDRV